MRTRLRTIALSLALCLCLAGCSTMGKPLPAPTLIPGEPQPSAAVYPMRAFTRTVGMYYPRNDTLALERKPVEIVCEEGMWLPEVLVHSMLEPVDTAALSNLFGGSAQLVHISSCSSMLVVELDYPDDLSQKELFASVLAMTRTLTLETGAQSVLYLHDGVRIPMAGLISNPMTADESISPDLWDQQAFYLENGYLSEAFGGTHTPKEEKQMHFYPDVSGKFILCDVTQAPTRRMNEAQAKALFELCPSNGESIAARFETDVTGFAWLADEAGEQSAVRVELSAPQSLTQDAVSLEVLRDLCVWNLRANDNRIRTVEIVLNGSLLGVYLDDGKTEYTGEESRDRFGEAITLYFLSPETGNLVTVERIVPFAESISAQSWMQELIRGPGPYDPEDLMPVFPEGLTVEDLLHIETDGINAVLDFSRNFEELYPVEDPFLERMMIYAVVNTLTEDAWIQRVFFRVEGQQPDSLGGALYLGTPLMRNPGVVTTYTEQNQGEGT